jgi:acyl-CoA thioesterase I
MGFSALTTGRHVRLVFSAIGLLAAGAAGPRTAAAESARGPAVVFFGDSLTAGYGLDDPDEAYPGLIAARVAAAGLPFEVVNAGVSGETTAGGVRRVDWVMRRPVAVFVLALGGNDGLRGIPVAETERNLQAIITAVREKSPSTRIVLAGMEAPPNLGPDFTDEFRAIFPRVAEANHLPLVPFLLEGVGGEPELNQRDGIHPTPAGQRIVADNVWRVLEPVLRERAPAKSATGE